MNSLITLALLAAAGSARSQTVTATTNLTLSSSIFEFDQSTLKINELDYHKTLRVRLKEAPSAKVSVFYEAQSLTFSQCGLEFTKENYQSYQELKVFPVPVFDVKDAIQKLAVKLKTTCTDAKFNDKIAEVPVERHVAASGTCSAVGDPHVKTFDGVNYDTFEPGPYYLVKSPALTVQVYQDYCNGSWKTFRGCIKAVAIRYGGSTVILDIRNNKKAVPEQVTPNVDGIVVQTNNDKSFDAKFGQSSIGLVYSMDPDYINVNVNLAAGYRGKTGGLCNAFGNGDGKTLKGADGAQYEPYKADAVKQFTTSWKVPVFDNLFYGNCKPAPPPTPVCPIKCNIPSAPAPIVYPPKPSNFPVYIIVSSPSPSPSPVASPSPVISVSQLPPSPTVSVLIQASPSVLVQASPSVSILVSASPFPSASASLKVVSSPYVQIVSSAYVVSSAYPSASPIPAPVPAKPEPQKIPPPAPAPQPPKDFVNECHQTCTNLINSTSCAAIIDPTFYVDVCKADALRSGNYFRAESIRQTFLKLCETRTNYMTQNINIQIVQVAEKVRKDAGLGEDVKCPNDCSGNGKCTKLGCVCQNSFAGIDCSHNLKKLIQYDEKKNEYRTDVPIPEEMVTEKKDEYANKEPGAVANPQVLNSGYNSKLIWHVLAAVPVIYTLFAF